MTWIGTDNLTQHLRASEEICFQGKHFRVAIYIFRRWKKICAWERKPQGVALSNPLVQQALSGLCQPLETVMSKPSGCKRLPACSGLLTLPGKVSRCCSCPEDEPVPSQWSWCSWTARVSVISAAAFRCRGRVWAGAGCEPWEGVNPTQTLELWCRAARIQPSEVRAASKTIYPLVDPNEKPLGVLRNKIAMSRNGRERRTCAVSNIFNKDQKQLVNLLFNKRLGFQCKNIVKKNDVVKQEPSSISLI